MSRPRLHALPTPVVATALALLGLLFPSESPAQETEPKRSSLASVSFVLPQGWQMETLPDQEVAPATLARLGRITGPDDRLRIQLYVLDPFGLDLKWKIRDLLGTLLYTTLDEHGISSRRIDKYEKSRCYFDGDSEEDEDDETRVSARMVTAETQLGGSERFVAAVGCGLQEPSRWLIVIIYVSAPLNRPMSLQLSLDQAAELLSTMRFD